MTDINNLSNAGCGEKEKVTGCKRNSLKVESAFIKFLKMGGKGEEFYLSI